MSGYEHIHADFRHVMALTDIERLGFLDQPRWIGHKVAQHILDTLQGLILQQIRLRNFDTKRSTCSGRAM